MPNKRTKKKNDDYGDNANEVIACSRGSVWFSDYISIDLDIAACGILSIEEMCDEAKYEKIDEEAKDNIQADEAEPTPIPSLSWKF